MKVELVHSWEDVPDFGSEDEEREFWLTHDLGPELIAELERREVPAGLKEQVAEKVIRAVRAAELPDVLYGLVLAWEDGGLGSYVWPLYEVTRRSFLAAGGPAVALWEPSWAQAGELPPGVPEDLPDRDLEVPLWEDERLEDEFWSYCGTKFTWEARVQFAIERVWREVAKELTRLEWRQLGVNVTDDFVALAYWNQWTVEGIREALRFSFGEEGYQELHERGWVPETATEQRQPTDAELKRWADEILEDPHR